MLWRSPPAKSRPTTKWSGDNRFQQDMHFFIDEAGAFIPAAIPGVPSYSLVLALIVPTATLDQLSYEFLRIRDGWPNNSIEIKGSRLDETQCNEVARLLAAHDAVVETQIIDMGLHDAACITDFQNKQAQAVTANLTPAHQPVLVREMEDIAKTFKALPNQLFVQAYLTMELVMKACEIGSLYYVQRMPKELANFTWVIDRKDKTLTEMEEVWSTFILPAAEAHFMNTCHGQADWCDYSHFAKYELRESDADPRWAGKFAWMRETYRRTDPPGSLRFTDLGKLLSEDQTFADSKANLGLQLADIAATSIRRAFNGNLQRTGWEAFGALMIKKKTPSFIALGTAASLKPSLEPNGTQVWRHLSGRFKPMLL